MDIICAKCGKHFSSIEGAREHNGHCRETSKGEPIHWVPARNSKIAPEEWENLMNLINARGVSQAITPSNLEPTAMESTGSEDSTEPNISIPSTTSENTQRIPNKKEAIKKKREKTSNFRIPT